jgi:hypothetical protein
MSEPTGKMHSAKLENSDRLQRVHRCLMSGPKTTLELVQQAGVCAVNSIVDELRDNGIAIECKRTGKNIWQYRLEGLF